MYFIPRGITLPLGEMKRIDKNLYVSEGDWYETESVQNTSFYKRNIFGYQPVCESARPVESVMTLLTGHIGKKNFVVHLLQHRYSFGYAETDIPLSFLLEYCLSMDCTPYVGIEKQTEEILSAVLFMVNHDEGYCHTFKFEIPVSVLDGEDGQFVAEAYTYTPINNLSE